MREGMAGENEDHQTVPVYNIVSAISTVSVEVDGSFEVMDEGTQQFQSEHGNVCEHNCSRNSSTRTERPLRTFINISERKRQKLASVCCVCGVFGVASGAGLILIYVLGEYTSLFNAFSNLQTLSIPGFAFLFLGIFTSVFGIFFCWIYTSENASRLSRANASDVESDRPHHLPGHEGYDNHALAVDQPPSYHSVARSQSFVTSLLKVGAAPIQKLPSYKTAIKIQKEEDKASSCGEVAEENDFNEDPPPPY